MTLGPPPPRGAYWTEHAPPMDVDLETARQSGATRVTHFLRVCRRHKQPLVWPRRNGRYHDRARCRRGCVDLTDWLVVATGRHPRIVGISDAEMGGEVFLSATELLDSERYLLGMATTGMVPGTRRRLPAEWRTRAAGLALWLHRSFATLTIRPKSAHPTL